ncbi:MAG: hypothetical protein CM1200mP28_04760 [Deltaproteobacteria bacterium]|nr:MAG: hypothetical protein CM1200mP28_04760 [Deltaproteobacteria bacterium]
MDWTSIIFSSPVALMTLLKHGGFLQGDQFVLCGIQFQVSSLKSQAQSVQFQLVQENDNEGLAQTHISNFSKSLNNPLFFRVNNKYPGGKPNTMPQI